MEFESNEEDTFVKWFSVEHREGFSDERRLSLSLSTDATDLPGSIESGEIVVSGSVYAPSSNSSYSGIESLSMRRVVTRGARGIDQSGQSE